MKWIPSNDLIAQLAHVGWGALIVESFALYDHALSGMIAAFAFAAVKEFVMDKYVEQASDHSNWRDFTFYTAGVALGSLVTWLARIQFTF